MLFNKEKIKEALDYYLIKDADYQEKCNICIDEIIKQKNIYIKAKEIYEILYTDETGKFKELWNKIKTSISNKGYFIGNFFGVKDEWNAGNFQIIFFTKEQVLELFTDFEIICFKEIEKDMLTGLGKMKHCHIFNVIAKKK